LIQRIGTQPHTFPPSHPDAQSTAHAALAAKNVQRGLAAKVQDLSATFRKKQRVYMESKFRLPMAIYLSISSWGRASSFRGPGCTLSLFTYDLPTELQGHAIKNQDLLIASGTISLKGSEGMSAVDDDVAAAVRLCVLRVPTFFVDPALCFLRVVHRLCCFCTVDPHASPVPVPLRPLTGPHPARSRTD
jgi:hypothetical protein